jgi:hypothetical protein
MFGGLRKVGANGLPLKSWQGIKVLCLSKESKEEERKDD